MEMMTRKRENTVIVSVAGRMDTVSAPPFDKKLETLMAEGDTCILIDFKDLEYMSSAGLQTILATAKKLERINGEIILLHLAGAVKEVFEISGFNHIFRSFDNEDAALA
jgi:anti-sigma B factor antagonist